MENGLSCSVVQDLLPNYIEKLISDETNVEVENHLDRCESCTEMHKQMITDVRLTEKIPVMEMHFFKKIKKTRMLAAGLCVILTILCTYLIYSSEYKYTIDKGSLSAAITLFTSPREMNVYVLETKEIHGSLIVSFKDQAQSNVYGIVEFDKGFNQKYRIIRAQIESSDYSSVVQVYPLEIKEKPYYVVSGYNISDEIKYYGLDYIGYTHPGYLSKDRVRESIIFDIKNNQFLDMTRANEVDSLLESLTKDNLYHLDLSTTSLYNADGEEVTSQYVIDGQKISSLVEKTELFTLYIYIAIVLGFGLILTRYFMTK